MTSSPFTLTDLGEGVHKLVFDLPGEKVNKLSVEVLQELEKIIDPLSQRKDVTALIIISAKKDIFIAGADIKQFEPAFKDPVYGRKIIENGQNVFNKLSKLPFPTIAAINGACLGGGCELALACTYRIATDSPKTVIGLPETSLGIIPGWGGTQRLPRLIGLQAGTEMVVSGKPISGSKAYKKGLVDAMAAPEFLESFAIDFAKKIKVKPLKRKNRGGLSQWLLEKNPAGRAFLFSQFKKGIIKQTKGFYPAPLLALDVIKETTGLPLEKGLKIEAEAFLKNGVKNVAIAKYLIGIFFGQEELKKNGGYQGALPKGKEVSDVAVIGAGTMGGGIAWLFSNKMIPARLKDIAWEAIGHGTKAAWDVYAKFIKTRKNTHNEALLKFHTISWGLDYEGFDKKNFIVESAVENLDLKRKVYSEIEAETSPETIIATNTSSLRVEDLARDMKNPERFVGMHFFNPATRMPLVEVVAGPKTSPEALATTIELAKKLGKIPLVVGDCNGFLVNRIFMMAANEAFFLLQEGASMKQLDKAMLDFGMPMGSCELADEVGIDVTYKVAKVFESAYGERFKTPALLEKIYDKKLLGKKTGKGFYLYKGKESSPNPEAQELIASFKGNKTFTDDEIVKRVMLSMVNEAARCLEEKIVHEPKYIDLAMILGTGFPPFRGGILAYADTLGLKQVYEDLLKLEQSSGVRFKPVAIIQRMAENNQGFYPN